MEVAGRALWWGHLTLMQLPHGSDPQPPGSGFFHFPPNTSGWNGQTTKKSKENFRSYCRLWGFHCPRAEEADLRMVLGPREQLNPGGDPNGIKRCKRAVCEEKVPTGSLWRGKPGKTPLRKHSLDWQL